MRSTTLLPRWRTAREFLEAAARSLALDGAQYTADDWRSLAADLEMVADYARRKAAAAERPTRARGRA